MWSLIKSSFYRFEASGREGTGFIPTNDNGPDKPGFKLLTSEDLARENGGDVNAYDDYDDVVVIGSSIWIPLAHFVFYNKLFSIKKLLLNLSFSLFLTEFE